MTRNNHIDIAKGIGILFVVLGHNWIVNHDKTLIFQMIYSFHMPLFFLLGGVFLSTRQGVADFARNKADALLKPYLVVLLLLGVYRIGVGATTPSQYFPGILYGVGSTIDWVQLWFLPSLFITLLFARLVLPLLQRTAFASLNLAGLVVVLFLVGALLVDSYRDIPSADSPLLSWMFGPDAHLRGLPFSLDLLPLSAAFLLLGYLLREQIKQAVFQPLHLLAAIAVFVLAHLLFRYSTDLNLREYGHWLITPLRALAGIYIVVSLSVLLTRYRVPAQTLAYLGRASLVILLFHAYVEWAIFGKLVNRFSEHPYAAGVAAFLGSLAISIGLYELSRRVPPMAWLLLQSNQRSGALKTAPSEQAA